MTGMEIADDLAEKLLAVINRCDDERTRLFAAMMVVADCIGGIECRDCRRHAKEAVEKGLPELIGQAMQRPTSGSNHIH